MKMGISGDHSTPSALTPPSSPSPPKSNLQMLYYGLVVMGTAAIILAIYNLIIMRWCANYQRQNRQGMIPTIEATSSRSLDNPNQGLVSSFKYKKEGVADQIGYDNECSVCISVFEEGEEVRKLPRCKHSFHAQCIDMWLYSHLDCPLCRAPVEPPVLRRHADATPSDNSREGLLDPGISA